MVPLAPIILLSASISVIVGILLYGSNPSNAINKVLLAISGVIFYWGFTEFEYFQASSFDQALLWVKVSAFWYLVPALALQFSVIYASVRVRKLVLYCVAYVPAIVLSVLEGLGLSYQSVWAPSVLDNASPVNPKLLQYNYLGYAGLIWATLISVSATIIVYLRYRRAKTDEEKSSAGYVLSGFLIPIIVGIPSNAGQNLFSVKIPDLVVPATAIGFVLFGYAVLRYGGYVLTATAAAEDILSTMADSLFLVNPGGQIIVSNDAASKLFEYAPSEIVGRTLSSLTKDRGVVEALLSDDPLSSYEADFLTKQGRLVPVSVSKSIIRTKRGNLAGHILIIRDITERKRMEGRLSEAERLVAIGETTTMVGHDLRNPLQAMTAAVYLMKELLASEKAEDRKEAVGLLSTVDDGIRYMDKIVSDLQDYARPVGADLVETSLPDLVRATVSSVKIPGNVQVTVDIHDGSSNLKLDPALLTRVLTNLILNALQAMPNGGKLRIAGSSGDGSITVAVEDTGVGIAPENLGRIFKPFFTTKAQGQGLGLAVCKRLIEAQGGTIQATSQVGKGSAFTLKIPTNRKPVT